MDFIYKEHFNQSHYIVEIQAQPLVVPPIEVKRHSGI